MSQNIEIVITGAGVVSPIGIGQEAFWASLREGRSGIRRLDMFHAPDMIAFGGEVTDFEPKKYVRQRKSLKVMSRDIQLAFTAADAACEQALHHQKPIDPERMGVVFGGDMIPCELDELVPAYRSCLVDGRFNYSRWGSAAMTDIFPLWMLKYLPNMPACHIGIAQDARGPNNTLTLGDVAGLSAAAEAVRILQRGAADALVVGGAGSRIHPSVIFRSGVCELSRRGHDPSSACRPFDANRDGMVWGEGAAALMFESIDHAQSRGAPLLARVLGYCTAFEPMRNGQALQGISIRQAIRGALKNSGLASNQIGCVIAHGISTISDDQIEASAIRDVLGEVPVTAPKSFYGHLGAGCGALEMVAGVLIMKHRQVPPTLNYSEPDPLCPVNVVHGRPQPLEHSTVMILSHSKYGQAVALILGSL